MEWVYPLAKILLIVGSISPAKDSPGTMSALGMTTLTASSLFAAFIYVLAFITFIYVLAF